MSSSVTNDDFIEDLMKKLFNEEASENKEPSSSDLKEKPKDSPEETSYNKRSKNRDLIPIVLQSSLKIEKIQQQRNENGELTGWANFIVPAKNLGLTREVLAKYRNEIYTSHFASFIAEIIIFENLNMFIEQLSDFNVESYDSAFSGLTHGTFGISYVNDKMIFMFHVSYINNLLISDFKKKV